MRERPTAYFELVDDAEFVICQHRCELQNLIEAPVRAGGLTVVENERHSPHPSCAFEDKQKVEAMQKLPLMS
jgi:hypothetical protein